MAVSIPVRTCVHHFSLPHNSSKKIDVRDPKAAKRTIQDIQTLSAAEAAVFSYPLEDLGVISACIDVQKPKYLLEPE